MSTELQTIHYVTSCGETVEVIGVTAVLYQKVCPYTGHIFYTEEIQRVHCCDSHKVMYFKKVPSSIRHSARR